MKKTDLVDCLFIYVMLCCGSHTRTEITIKIYIYTEPPDGHSAWHLNAPALHCEYWKPKCNWCGDFKTKFKVHKCVSIHCNTIRLFAHIKTINLVDKNINSYKFSNWKRNHSFSSFAQNTVCDYKVTKFHPLTSTAVRPPEEVRNENRTHV